MSQRAKELSERFMSFNTEVIAFVENCSDENWRKKGLHIKSTINFLSLPFQLRQRMILNVVLIE